MEGRGFPIVLDLKPSSFEVAVVWHDVLQVFVKICWRMNAVKLVSQHMRSHINQETTKSCIIGGLFSR